MDTARTEQAWLATVRTAILRGALTDAHASATRALAAFPDSADLKRALAGVLHRVGQGAEAEALLRELLTREGTDTSSAFALAGILKEQGRTAAAAATLRDCMAHEPNRKDANLAIAGIELLADIGRLREAAAIAEAAIVGTPDDPRLHAYAGMLAIQLGQFERARARYLFALTHDPRALEWHVGIGLASTLRYRNAAHPDFERYRSGLARPDISPLARAELEFALGKAFDDVGDYAKAARHFRTGNTMRHDLAAWSPKAWRRSVAARLAAHRAPITASPTQGFTPVFIVGMPRTGTTLLAERLSRNADVCNRGELPVLAQLAQQPALAGTPERAALRHAADAYAMRSRQDDAPDARWFIDKQPLNFRYIDLALTLFPDARIIHCQRGARDNALSLWQQCFLEDAQNYTYDFVDMALVMRDEARLMAHWRDLYPDSIRAVHYEDLVTDPTTTVTQLAEWIGMSRAREAPEARTRPDSTISTASLWQARQPVNARSVGRWKHYAADVPELLRFAD